MMTGALNCQFVVAIQGCVVYHHFSAYLTGGTCQSARSSSDSVTSNGVRRWCSVIVAAMCAPIRICHLNFSKCHNKCPNVIQVAGGILLGANAVSQRLLEHGVKMTAGSEPCANPRPLPGVVTGAASATRSTTKAASKVANKVGKEKS